jgi:hypothetical protein
VLAVRALKIKDGAVPLRRGNACSGSWPRHAGRDPSTAVLVHQRERAPSLGMTKLEIALELSTSREVGSRAPSSRSPWNPTLAALERAGCGQFTGGKDGAPSVVVRPARTEGGQPADLFIVV